MPRSCCGLAHYNISIVLLKGALNHSCQLRLAVTASEGSFCNKLLFPIMCLQRGSETRLDLECFKSHSCQWLSLSQLECLYERVKQSKVEDGPIAVTPSSSH